MAMYWLPRLLVKSVAATCEVVDISALCSVSAYLHI